MVAWSAALLLVLAADEPAVDGGEPEPTPVRVEAAATAGLELSDQDDGVLVYTQTLHGRVDVERSWGAFTARARGSLLVTADTQAGGTPLLVARDLGSFAALEYRARDVAVSLTVLPLASRALRVGFDFANDWGAPMFSPPGLPEPGVVVALRHPRFDCFVGGRVTATEFPGVSRGSLLSGGGAALPAGLRFDLRGQVLFEGEGQGVFAGGTELIRVLGVTRLGWRLGQAVGTPFDLQTYRSDPQRFERFFAPLPAVGASGLEVSLEAGLGNPQKLVDPPLFAQLQASAMGGRGRVTLTGRLRTAAMLAFDEPNFSGTTPAGPNLVFMASGDYRLGAFAPGLAFYAMTPAWEDSLAFNIPRMLALSGPESRVAVRQNSFTRPSARWGAKVLLRLDLGDHLTLLGQLNVDLEPTRHIVLADANGLSMTAGPLSVGAQLYAQLRL